MNGAAFLSYVKQSFKRTDKDTEIYTATADTVMDMRARMLSDEFSTISAALTGLGVVGNYIATLPTDFGHLIGSPSVRDTATDQVYDPLNKITKEEYDEKYSQNNASSASLRLTGVPVDFCYYGGQIYVGPAVDATTYEIKINYTTEDTPTITGATATVQFTDQFREVVRAGVLYRMFLELGFATEAANWAAVYENGIQKIIDNDLSNAGSSSIGIQYGGI